MSGGGTAGPYGVAQLSEDEIDRLLSAALAQVQEPADPVAPGLIDPLTLSVEIHAGDRDAWLADYVDGPNGRLRPLYDLVLSVIADGHHAWGEGREPIDRACSTSGH
jgi:hypothetical protein